MSPYGAAAAEVLRSTLSGLEEHARANPAEVDEIIGAVVAHLRSWRPEALLAGSLTPSEVLP